MRPHESVSDGRHSRSDAQARAITRTIERAVTLHAGYLAQTSVPTRKDLVHRDRNRARWQSRFRSQADIPPCGYRKLQKIP
jgi:hypothetical protein